jgi:hypothetical protein
MVLVLKIVTKNSEHQEIKGHLGVTNLSLLMVKNGTFYNYK